VTFKNGKKPERLIRRVLELTTKSKDLVLDSFLGSGTTCAVAHKMGRRWIGIELGQQCYTHCLPRLQRVVLGKDTTGVSQILNWQGGGGFRFYELAETLINEDDWGQKVINPNYNPEMLAQAVCKLEGFTYKPKQSRDEYFIHGYSTEHDYIFVTTSFMSVQHLESLSKRLGTNRTLLICCGGYEPSSTHAFGNITLKTIPQAIMNKCEYGHDDYSLNIKNLPMMQKDEKPTQMEFDFSEEEQ
jgi:adenine-specific DNA-methyltransferase